MNIKEILDLSHALQSWRPDSFTIDLHNSIQRPFCPTCADWHMPTEDHSHTDLDAE